MQFKIVISLFMDHFPLFVLAAKSPVFTHLATTLTGLSTVRAFNAEKILRYEFDLHQDTHSACWYMFLATSGAFAFSLEILCLLFVCCIVLYYVVIDTNASGNMVGLALTQAMSLSGLLQYGTRIVHSDVLKMKIIQIQMIIYF